MKLLDWFSPLLSRWSVNDEICRYARFVKDKEQRREIVCDKGERESVCV